MQNTLKRRLEDEFNNRFGKKEQHEPIPVHDELGIPMAESITTTKYVLADNPDVIKWIKQFISREIIGTDEPEYYDKEKKYKDHEAITRNNLRKEQRKRYETK